MVKTAINATRPTKKPCKPSSRKLIGRSEFKARITSTSGAIPGTPGAAVVESARGGPRRVHRCRCPLNRHYCCLALNRRPAVSRLYCSRTFGPGSSTGNVADSILCGLPRR
jgi:hypothetical protein